MIAERARADWGFWLLWVLATAVGWSVGWAIGGVVGERLGGPVSFGVGGSMAGILQWPVLRQCIARAGRWALVSIGGLVAGAIIGVSMELGTNGAVPRIIGNPVGIVLLTIGQWLILRRHIPRAGWWPLANITGVAVGGAVVFIVSLAVRGGVSGAASWGLLEGVFGAVLGAAFGAITGVTLAWLLRQPVPETAGETTKAL